LFVDSVDIHDRARRINHYGPVLFVFNIGQLRRTYTGRLWVTKQNPANWTGLKRKDKWFQSSDELEQDFIEGEFAQSVVLRHCGGELPFTSFLQEIVVDDPRLTVEGTDLFSAACGALSLAVTDSGLEIPIRKRQCRPQCACRNYYGRRAQTAYERFVPQAL
jgi:hypothetical protein